MSGQESSGGDAGGASSLPAPKRKLHRKNAKKINKMIRRAKKNAKIESISFADLPKILDKLTLTSTDNESELNPSTSEEKEPNPKQENPEMNPDLADEEKKVDPIEEEINQDPINEEKNLDPIEEEKKLDPIEEENEGEDILLPGYKAKKKRYRRKKKNTAAAAETDASNTELVPPEEPKPAATVSNVQMAMAREESKPSTSGTVNKLTYSEVVKPSSSRAPVLPAPPEYRPLSPNNIWSPQRNVDYHNYCYYDGTHLYTYFDEHWNDRY